MLSNKAIDRMRAICDQFAWWQSEDGGISKERCPYFAEEYKPFFRYMEVPFMGRALYIMYEATQESHYKTAADKYMLFYIDLICNLITEERIAYKFGMALEAAALYARYNPQETAEMRVYIGLFLKWLRQLKDESLGSYFRCGYVVDGSEPPETDVGFSDDLCHVGRGLTRAYELLGGAEILADIEALSKYFVTDQRNNTQDGIWNPTLGTWSIGPWPDKNFEHMENTAANEAGWVFSAYGDAEYLLDAAEHLDGMDTAILKEHCVRSVEWIFANCMFDDGAIGMTTRDDKWLGLTAAAVLGVVKLFEEDILDETERRRLSPILKRSWSFLLDNTGDAMPEAAYIKVTGDTSPVPGDNVAWLLSWIVEALAKEAEINNIIG